MCLKRNLNYKLIHKLYASNNSIKISGNSQNLQQKPTHYCHPIIISNSTNCYFVTSSAVEMQKLCSTALDVTIGILNKSLNHYQKNL
jgi:hypothetical protein